jgi:hypothetical protein
MVRRSAKIKWFKEGEKSGDLKETQGYEADDLASATGK